METDIILDESGDLQFVNGDLRTGVDLVQRQNTLLLAVPGDFKSAPLSGVDVLSFVNDEETWQLELSIRQQFEDDGLKIKRLSISNWENVEIEADYGK